jgi:tyrosine-protein phosphatase SIW14
MEGILPLPRRIRPRIVSRIYYPSRICCAIVAIAVGLRAAEVPRVPHVPNFGQVDATLYRGAQPSAAGLEELQACGVKLVIDLRESGEATSRERLEANRLGLQYRNVPLRSLAAPSSEQVRTVLALLANRSDSPAFLHCRRGKDRTGLMIACYRIQHDRWSNDRALQEANEYGMSRLERGMRSFVLHFSAFPVEALALSASAPVLSIQP